MAFTHNKKVALESFIIARIQIRIRSKRSGSATLQSSQVLFMQLLNIILHTTHALHLTLLPLFSVNFKFFSESAMHDTFNEIYNQQSVFNIHYPVC
jgi:hypothetical protein